jgi:lysophospholipase L1-like esterase
MGSPLPPSDLHTVLDRFDRMELKGDGYIYGAGEEGGVLARRLAWSGRAGVKGFVDRRSAELRFHLGKPVVSPADLAGLSYDWILVPPRRGREMVAELQLRHVPDDKIIQFDAIPAEPGPEAPAAATAGRVWLPAALAAALMIVLGAAILQHRLVLPLAAGLGLLLLGEAASRLLFRTPPSFRPAILDQCFHPFLMTVSTPTGAGDGRTTWDDQQRGTRIQAVHRRNRQGFRMDEDLDAAKPRAKAPNEKLVLLTGGSTVHGVGATCSETTIAAQLEVALNAGQDTYRYRVLNFGQSNWVAFQEYLALAMWGKWMEPDWIVVMDGHNDISVPVAHSQGAGYPMFYHHLKSYVDGYLVGQVRPSFYRGALENRLLRHSHLYRSCTGKQYVPRDQHLVFDEGFPRVATEVRFEDIEQQVACYRHAQELILGLSDRAKCLFSLQPLIQPHSQVFGLTDGDLQRMLVQNRHQRVGYKDFYTLALPYFMNRAERELRDMVAQEDPERASFINLNECFPDAFQDRAWYFIDNMHLNDMGSWWVGKVFCHRILAQDLPDRKEALDQAMADDLRAMDAVCIKNQGPRFNRRYRDMISADSQEAFTGSSALLHQRSRKALSRLLLGFAYFGILTPTAGLLKLMGKDFLRARLWKQGKGSTFTPKDHWFQPDDFNSP